MRFMDDDWSLSCGGNSTAASAIPIGKAARRPPAICSRNIAICTVLPLLDVNLSLEFSINILPLRKYSSIDVLTFFRALTCLTNEPLDGCIGHLRCTALIHSPSAHGQDKRPTWMIYCFLILIPAIPAIAFVLLSQTPMTPIEPTLGGREHAACQCRHRPLDGDYLLILLAFNLHKLHDGGKDS